MTTELAADLLTGEGGRSRFLQTVAERERLERVLLMLPTALNEYMPRHAVDVFAEAACEITSARLGLVVLPDLLHDPLIFGADASLLDPMCDPSRIRAFGAAFDGSVLYLPDITAVLTKTERGALGGTTDGRELRSVLALPIRGRAPRALGVLFLAHHRSRAFSERQVALAAALAAHLGHTIEVTDAVTEQTRVSTALQESLLPPLLPSVPGLDIAARYRPSGHGNLVGGDFYDVFPGTTGSWNLLLGDASGIGPEAAGLAGIARYTARALAESVSSPSEVLRLVNRAVRRAASDGRFCTAVLAGFAFDEDGVLVSLASSGHPSAFLQRSNGDVQPAMEQTGTILGVLDDAPVGERQFRLEPGDALVFYTDGVTEARDAAGELFGEERLMSVLAGAIGRSAAGIARRVELEVLDHRGSQNTDDVAIVVVRTPAISTRASVALR